MNGGRDHRCGDAVGWGTALQVRKSRIRFLMASLEYFTDLILQATIRPRGRISLYRMSTRNISWVGTGSWCKGLTILPPSCADCLEIWEPQSPGTIKACPGVALPLPGDWKVPVHLCKKGDALHWKWQSPTHKIFKVANVTSVMQSQFSPVPHSWSAVLNICSVWLLL
jgi:hypothetical protein